MTRRLLNLVTILSLLLFVAVVAFWLRSYAVGDQFHVARFRENGRWTFWVRDELRVWGGRAGFSRTVSSGPPATYRAFIEKNVRKQEVEPQFHRRVEPRNAAMKMGNKAKRCLGFEAARSSYVRQDGSVCSGRYSATAPLWPFASAAGVIPALVCVSLGRRRLRRVAGLCIRCGYDLRATPDRCPDCGVVVTVAATI